MWHVICDVALQVCFLVIVWEFLGFYCSCAWKIKGHSYSHTDTYMVCLCHRLYDLTSRMMERTGAVQWFVQAKLIEVVKVTIPLIVNMTASISGLFNHQNSNLNIYNERINEWISWLLFATTIKIKEITDNRNLQ